MAHLISDKLVNKAKQKIVQNLEVAIKHNQSASRTTKD
jgi:hypothetical protein